MHTYVGIDISQNDFAAAIFIVPGEPILIRDGFENNSNGFEIFTTWLKESKADQKHTLICVEHAGVYSEAICHYLLKKDYHVCLESASKVKRAFKLKGHKTDPLDARQIAEYAYRFHDQLELFAPKELVIEQLNTWLTLREQLIKQRTALSNILHALDKKVQKTPRAIRLCKKQIEELTHQVKSIESEIELLIAKDHSCYKTVLILKSVPGIGFLTAVNLLVITNAFSDISEYPKLAAYLGIVPMKKESGTSVRKRARSDRFGPPRIRKLLHLCARSIVNHDIKFKAYYTRKVEEGKPKMLVLNNVANKLLRVSCALVRDQKMYEPKHVSMSPILL